MQRAFDMPELTDEERAAEHGMRHDLLLALYDELEPAFDVSLWWPPNGYEVDGAGGLIGAEAQFTGLAATGYDHGYDFQVFYEGDARDNGYVEGFVDGSLERLGEEEPEEESMLRRLWEDGGAEDRFFVLEDLKARCEVRGGPF